MPRLDPAEIARVREAVDLRRIMDADGRKLVPEGSRTRVLCPFHQERTPSCVVDEARAHCFGCGADFDAIEYISHTRGLGFRDALELLAKGAVVPLDATPRQVRDPGTRHTWLPMDPVPRIAPPLRARHVAYGDPVRQWEYRSADDRLRAVDVRYEYEKDGARKKAVLTWTWCENRDTGEQRWHPKPLPAPHPIYGADRLARNPDALVIVCEGCKAAEGAAVALGPGHQGVSWRGGVDQARQGRNDWSPLRGRDVLLWPDADVVGIEAMLRIMPEIAAIASSVERMEVGQLPAGWDLGDA